MVDPERLDAWFVGEVLPLEPDLMRFLRRNWRNESDVADLRQELYVRLYDAGPLAVAFEADSGEATVVTYGWAELRS